MTGFGFALAGMAQGTGNAILERAKERRELMKERIRNQWANERLESQQAFSADQADKDRDFRRSEREAAQQFQLQHLRTDGKQDSKEKEISRLQSLGVDRETAVKITDGIVTIKTNPVTGDHVMVDMVTGKSRPVTTEQAQSISSEVLQRTGATGEVGQSGQKTLWEMAPDATGVGATAKRAVSDTVGQVPGPIGDMATFPDTVEAQQEFELFRKELIRTLALNQRYPVAEQKRLENLLPLGALSSPETLKTTLRALDEEFERILQQTESDINDTSLPVETRQEAKKTNLFVKRARERIGLPADTVTPKNRGGQEQGGGVVSEDDVYEKARKAIQKGADENLVRQRLRENGFDPGRL